MSRAFDAVERSLRVVTDRLSLPPAAPVVLELLARVDLDPEVAVAVRQGDEQQRDGVVSWASLLTLVDAPVDDLGAAVLALADWGLVQIVGAHATDVRVPGSAPLRLAHPGRVALGLAPRLRLPPPPGGPAMPWTVLHGPAAEPLAMAARGLGGDLPTVRLADHAGADAAAGACAVALLLDGGVVVDAYDPTQAPLAAAVLARTVRARGPRFLLLAAPTLVREAAARGDAVLRWIGGVSSGPDPARTRAILDRDPTATRADACAVAGSGVARPRRVQVAWSDLALPDATARRLELIRLHALSRTSGAVSPLVGHARGGGYRLLLCGLPGTGKSLTAAALASSLARPLVKVDLSAVLSKWLGETEKLLGEVFEVAESSDAVLVLDEAESLFRQRDSGSGASSGLATAVAYLLGRLDDFSGVLVATTNRVDDLDEAFYRRFDDYLVLPMPDTSTRRLLWRRLLGDVPFDVGDLEGVAVSGGLIEGAALRARAWAAAAEVPLAAELVLASLALELEKSGRPTREILAGRHGEAVRAVLERGLVGPDGGPLRHTPGMQSPSATPPARSSG